MSTHRLGSALDHASPVPIASEIQVRPGPALLHGIEFGPSHGAHRVQYGDLPRVGLAELTALTHQIRLRGRGGGAFPFTTKLHTTSQGRRRAVVVVNLSESEPGSAKDTALALTRPHLILDGASAAARALGTWEVHVALSAKRPMAYEQMVQAISERDDPIDWQPHLGEDKFVAGQSRAVIELLSGRPNRPVTAWEPEAVSGHRGRPTLLSNAETWAHVGRLVLLGATAYSRFGTTSEPGTTLLTHTEVGVQPTVLEVEYGTPWREVLPVRSHGRGSLIGGFHGAWLPWASLATGHVSIDAMRSIGGGLGAGAVLTPGIGDCPVRLTARITKYLAQQSARKCGPCLNGLPALAGALVAVSDGTGAPEEVRRLSALVAGRGACSHPDGTVRLVASMLAAFPEEVTAHAHGECLSRNRELV